MNITPDYNLPPAHVKSHKEPQTPSPPQKEVVLQIMEEMLLSTRESEKTLKAAKEELPVSSASPGKAKRIFQWLFKSPSSSKKEVPAEIRKTLAKAKHLFDSAKARGSLLDEDIEELEAFRHDLAEQEADLRTVSQSPDEGLIYLTEEELEVSKNILKIAGEALVQLDGLYQSSKSTESEEKILAAAIDTIEKSVFTPEYLGQSLNVMPAFRNAVNSLTYLAAEEYGLVSGSLSRGCADEMVENGAKMLAFSLSDWLENSMEVIDLQMKALQHSYHSAGKDDKPHCTALLSSLARQMIVLKNQARAIAKSLASYPELNGVRENFQQAFDQMAAKLDELKDSIRNEGIVLNKKPMEYGSDEWKVLAERLLPAPPQEKEVKRWKPGKQTKRILRSALTLMQLTHHAISMARRLEETQFRAQSTPSSSPPFPSPDTQDTPKTGLISRAHDAISSVGTLIGSYLFSTTSGAEAQLSQKKQSEEQNAARSLRTLQAFIEQPGGFTGVGDSDRLYQHVLGAFFGKGTGLEGNPSLHTLKYISHLLSNKMAALEADQSLTDEERLEMSWLFYNQPKHPLHGTFSKLTTQMRLAEEITTALEHLTPPKFTEFLKDKIAGLQPDGSFYFMGGWVGHAIVYEVIRQKDNRFTFRMYNRGDGINHHAQTVVEGKTHYMPFTEIVDITEEGMTNPVFLYGIKEIVTPPDKSHPDWGPEDLYTTLLPSLGGRTSARHYSRDHLMRQVFSGHCTYLSQTALMNIQLGDRQTYERWQFEIELKTLLDYHAQSRHQLSGNEQMLRLMKEGVAQFSRNLVSARTSGMVSDMETAWIENKLQEVKESLRHAEKEYQEHIAERAPVISIRPSRSLEGIKMNIPVPEPQSDQAQLMPKHAPFIDRQEWSYSPDRFLSDLGSLIDEVHTIGAFHPQSTRVAIETFIGKIPLEGNIFWKGMTPVDAQHAMSLLQELSISYFESIDTGNKEQANNSDKLFIEDYLTAVKILTLSDALAVDFKDSWGMAFPNLFQKPIWRVLDSVSVASTVPSLKWEDERRQMRSYWLNKLKDDNNRKSWVSFFGFELGVSAGEKALRKFHRQQVFLEHDKYDDDVFDWQDVEFAAQWAHRPEVLSKLPEDLRNERSSVKGVMLLSDAHEGKAYSLPSQFYALRDISRVVYYLNSGWTSSETPQFIRNQLFHGLKLQTVTKEDVILEDLGQTWLIQNGEITNKMERQIGEWLETPFDINGRHAYLRRAPSQKKRLEEAEMTDQKRKLCHALNNYRHISINAVPPDTYLRKGELIFGHMLKEGDGENAFYYSHRMRIEPHQRMGAVVQGYLSSLQLPLSEIQEFTALSSVREFQVRETLTFFKKNSHLLKEIRYRDVFAYLMNENGLLIDEMLKGTQEAHQFINMLGAFCKEQIDLYRKLGDTDSLLDMLEINQQFSATFHYIEKHYPGTFPIEFPSPFFGNRELLRQISTSPAYSTVDQGIAYRILMQAASQDDLLSSESTLDLIKAALHFDIHGFPDDDMKWDPKKIKEVQDLFLKLQKPLEHALSNPADRNRLFNEAVASIVPAFNSASWQPAPSFPYFQSEDGKYTLNLEKGMLFVRGESLRPLSPSEKDHPFVKSVLGEASQTLATRSHDGTRQFSDTEGNEYLLKRDENQGILFFRKRNGKWFQAHDPKVISDQLPYQQLFANSIVWIGESSKDSFPAKVEVLIADKSTNRINYLIDMEQGHTQAQDYHRLKQVRRIGANGQETGEVLTDLNNESSLNAFLTRLENPQYLLVWQNKESGMPTAFELPRYGLTFNITEREGQTIAIPDKYPELRLAQHQYLPQLGDITSYLVLEDKDGNTFALMPQLYMHKLEHPLFTRTALNPSETINERFAHFIHKARNDGSDIIPDSDEARFHLATLYLWERDYARAIKYLRGYESMTKPFTEKEAGLLNQISTMADFNKDTTPEASATRLYAYYLSKRNHESFTSDGGQDKEKLPFGALLNGNDLEVYIQSLDQLGNYRLKPEEELALGIHVSSENDEAPTQVTLIGSNVSPSQSDAEDVDVCKAYDLTEMGKVLSTKDEIPAPQSLFYPPVHRYFLPLYQLFKSDFSSNQKNALEILEKFTGVRLPESTDPAVIRKTYLDALSASTLRIPHPSNQIGFTNWVLASALLSVLASPEVFPSPGLISQKYNSNIENFLRDERVIEKAFDLLKEPLKQQQGELDIFIKPRHPAAFALNAQVPPLAWADKMSIAFEDDKSLKFSGVERLDRFLEWVPAPPETVAQARLTARDLNERLDLQTSDPAFNSKFETVRSNIGKAAKMRAVSLGHYRLRSFEALNALKAELHNKSLMLSPLLAEQETTILALANKPFDSAALQAEREAKIAGRLEKPLNMAELFHLFRTRDLEQIALRNPALSPAEIGALYELVKQHLETITLNQHQIRMLNTIAKIEKNPGNEELQSLVDELAASANANRQYDVATHPEYLILEKEANILIRKDQIQNLERMAKYVKRAGSSMENGAALEAIPGSGKTAVLLALQAINDADGENHSILMVPKTLLPVVAQQLQIILGDGYEMSVELWNYDRNSPFDEKHLKRHYDDLAGQQAKKKVTLISNESYLSFINQYRLMAVAYKESLVNGPAISTVGAIQNREAFVKAFKIATDIIAHFRNKGVASLDEMDLILEIRNSLHFPMGQPRPLKPEVAFAAISLYGFLATSDEIQNLIKFPFISSGKGLPFTEERYREKIIPVLVKKILDGTIVKGDEEVVSFLEKLTGEQRELLTEYLHDRKSPAVTAFVKQIPSVKVKNVLSVLKKEINNIIPTTAPKKVNEHFGAVPPEMAGKKIGSDLSIPYHGSNNPAVIRDPVSGNPVSNSEHGSQLEKINYAIQMQLALGIKSKFIIKEIEEYRRIFEEELTSGVVKDPADSKVYQKFVKLCGGDTRYNLYRLSKEDIEEITAYVNRTPSIQLELILKYILPQVVTYPREFSASGQLYASLMHRVKGFSGTLWNAEAFPNIFYQIFESDTLGETLNILWENSPKEVATLIPPEKQSDQTQNANAIVKEIYGRNGGFKQSFIDAAGVFREITDNKLVAKAILETQPAEIRGISFYDKQNNLLVLRRGEEEAVPIERCRLSKDEIIAYWDQQHTTGSDVKLGATMTATVSIGEHTMVRDLIQAVWRLRGLKTGQRVDFIVLDEDRQVILETLKRLTGKTGGETLDLGDLFIYTLYKQMTRQGDDNYRSFKSKLDSVLESKVFEVVIDENVKIEDKIDAIYAIHELFVETEPEEPHELYGSIEEVLPMEEAVTNDLEKILHGSPFAAFKTLPVLSTRFSADDIEKELRQVADNEKRKLSANITQTSGYEKELTLEVEAELESEKEKEKEKEKAAEIYYRDLPFLRAPVYPWKQEIFSSKAYDPSPIEEIKSIGFDDMLRRNASAVVLINDVISKDEQTSDYKDIFDADLLTTLNMMPLYITQSKNAPWAEFHPMGMHQDINYAMVVVETIGSGELKVVIADQEDIKALDQTLSLDAKDPFEGKRDVRICLYHPVIGVIKQGSDRIDGAALEKNPRFIRAKVQTKFMAGDVFYTPEERRFLSEWIVEKGPEKMRKLFENVILPNKSRAQSQYAKSDINNIFDQLIG